ncbi:MAG: N-acetyl-alpha-D-glucosaminyl L-malate synthase BshA [Bacteroidetes bacterium]|nr:N-acetyl-alpha-D-glucosaminyl L-malate synthase BshA [Bacteroidota bacterium]
MKIGIVCYPTYGGSGVVATELGIELAKRGHEVHFITYAQPMRLDRFQDNIFYHEVEQPHYPLFEFPLYSLALAGKIIDVVKYEQLDVLHVHYAIPHAISGFLAKEILKEERNIALVTTLHGTDITLIGLEPTFLPLVKFSLDQSDAVTAVSKFLADKTVSGFKTLHEPIVIPNFVDTTVYHRMESTKIRSQIAPNDEKILIHVSNFRSVKRVVDTIHIAHEVLKSMPIKLVLVGDGPDRVEAERISRELGIHEHVRFLGKQNALPEILSTADIFLMPSQSESFGLAALEAMACGVPVIGTNLGGIPEVITHSENGYIAELGDIKRMAKYALELLSNKKKWELFSTNCRQSAIDNFDIHRIVPMYEALYSRTLQTIHGT